MVDKNELKSLSKTMPVFYTASYFIEENHRLGFLFITSFLMEMERILHQKGEPMMASIRFAWWAEQIEAMPNGRFERLPLNEGVLNLISQNEALRGHFQGMVHAAHDALDNKNNPFLFQDLRKFLWIEMVKAYFSYCCVCDDDGALSLGGQLFEHMTSENHLPLSVPSIYPRAYVPLFVVLAHKGKRGPVGPLSLLKMLRIAMRGRL